MRIKTNAGRWIATSLLALGSLGAAPATVANLIENGSFELPAISGWRVFGSIPGWVTRAGSGIEIQNNVAGAAYDGLRHVELDSYNNSRIGQQIETEAGVLYDLTFAYSPRGRVAAASNGMTVHWDGLLIDELAAPGLANGQTDWLLNSYELLGTGGLVWLEFGASGRSDGLGAYLDAVVLTARPVDSGSKAAGNVPLPGTLALLALGMAGLGWARRGSHS